MAKKSENKDYTYATGKRKQSIARVRITPGTGIITINGKPLDEIYKLDTMKAMVKAPFMKTNTDIKYDVIATVNGGGFAGQAGAVACGIAKALATTDEEIRLTLKRAGMLTRDSRVKERHHYGLKKARKAPQFSKR